MAGEEKQDEKGDHPTMNWAKNHAVTPLGDEEEKLSE
jgi:hypothetical protein